MGNVIALATNTPVEPPGRFFASVLSFAWVLPSAIAVGAGLGYALDWLLGITPILTLALGLVGFAAGVRQLLREAAVLSGEDRGDRHE